MDVLRPPCIYVDGRCYRLNEGDLENGNSKQSGVEWDDYTSNYGTDCTEDEPCDGGDDYDIVLLDSGRYKTSFHVARTYYAPIIGTKGQTKKRLEDETKTLIKVPRLPQEHEIMITGTKRRSVASARRRIELMVLSFRRKQQATHFLSIPMVSSEVKKRFLQFKEEVLRDCQARGVDESIFQSPDKLHLTLCTLVLGDDVERTKAAKVLESCKQEVIDPLMEGHCITILLSGVGYMNDDPAEVDVLYAVVLADEILQRLVDEVVDYCANAGLIDKQFERVKLHVTVMNTLFRETKSDNFGRPKKRETFNASPILAKVLEAEGGRYAMELAGLVGWSPEVGCGHYQRFKDYEFGEVTIDTIQLSTRFTTSKTDGYYQSSTRMSLLI